MSEIKVIKILNPVAGCGYTNPRQAEKFVSRGLAEYVRPGVIRFVNTKSQAANRKMHKNAKAWDAEVPSLDKTFYSWRGARPIWGKPIRLPGEVRS